MRKDFVVAAGARCLLLWLAFCLMGQSLPVFAQQPSTSAPPQPAARPGQTQPPSAPRSNAPATSSSSSSSSSSSAQDEGSSSSQSRERPSPYYSYPFGSQTNEQRSLTVDEAVRLALSNASAYRQTQFDERIAAQDVHQSRAAFFPQITMPLTYFGTTPSVVRGPDDPVTYSYLSSSGIHETIALLNASGEIDLSGRLRASLERSRHLLAAASAGAQVARRELALATIDAYYTLALARQKRRLADETLGLAEGFLKVSQGAGEHSEMHRALSAARARRDELEQARAGEAAAMDLLRALTGIDFKTFVNIKRITEDVPTVSDFLGYTEELIKNRPELTVLEAQKRAALQDARIARSERLPQLTYSINGGFDAGDFRPLKRYVGGSAIVTLTIPIFNFGASRSREIQARLRAEQLDVQRESTLRQLRQEFYTNRAAALAALERIRETREASQAAQEHITMVFANYRLKKAEITDVIDAQSAFAETRTAYYQAIADYRTSRIRLEVDPEQLLGVRESQALVARSNATREYPRCIYNLAQAPVIGGLRLGMTQAEVQARFPDKQPSAADESGVSILQLKGTGSMAAQDRTVEGADSITLEFTDGRLSFIRVRYPATNRWDNKDEFTATVADLLNINGHWRPFYDWENKTIRDTTDLRDLALECNGFRLSAGIGIEGVSGDQTPHFELEDVLAAQTVKAREEQRAARAAREQAESGEDQTNSSESDRQNRQTVGSSTRDDERPDAGPRPATTVQRPDAPARNTGSNTVQRTPRIRPRVKRRD